jgi:hypothetical protein
VDGDGERPSRRGPERRDLRPVGGPEAWAHRGGSTTGRSAFCSAQRMAYGPPPRPRSTALSPGSPRRADSGLPAGSERRVCRVVGLNRATVRRVARAPEARPRHVAPELLTRLRPPALRALLHRRPPASSAALAHEGFGLPLLEAVAAVVGMALRDDRPDSGRLSQGPLGQYAYRTATRRNVKVCQKRCRQASLPYTSLWVREASNTPTWETYCRT